MILEAHIWWLVESPILSKVLQLFDAKQSNLKKKPLKIIIKYGLILKSMILKLMV